MQICCKTLTGTSLYLEIDNDILIKDLKELIRVKLSLSPVDEIILSRGNIDTIKDTDTFKDTDTLVVSKKENSEESLPFIQTEGEQTHLSGIPFIVLVRAPKEILTNSSWNVTEFIAKANSANPVKEEIDALTFEQFCDVLRADPGCANHILLEYESVKKLVDSNERISALWKINSQYTHHFIAYRQIAPSPFESYEELKSFDKELRDDLITHYPSCALSLFQGPKNLEAFLDWCNDEPALVRFLVEKYPHAVLSLFDEETFQKHAETLARQIGSSAKLLAEKLKVITHNKALHSKALPIEPDWMKLTLWEQSSTSGKAKLVFSHILDAAIVGLFVAGIAVPGVQPLFLVLGTALAFGRMIQLLGTERCSVVPYTPDDFTDKAIFKHYYPSAAY